MILVIARPLMKKDGFMSRSVLTIVAIVVSCLPAREARSQDSPAKVRGSTSEKRDDARARSTFYDPGVVQTIKLEVAARDLARMHAALPERIYVPGTFRWNDIELERVGVRYKGDSSSSPEQRHKRSFLIKFSEFVAGGRFLGLRRVALDNGVQFGGLFSERLITDTLRTVGVHAPRTNYARVHLNGDYQGIYVNVERLDRAYLANHFDDANGDLYKVHQGGPGADLAFVGDDPLLYRKTFEPKGKNDSLLPVVSLIREINETSPEMFAQRLRELLDVDAFISMMGVLLLSGAFDQYTGWGPHNYYPYRGSSSGRWTYLPWDLDVGFVESAFGRVPVIDGWNAAWPVPVSPRPLLERIVANKQLITLYRQRADKLLEAHFRPDVLGARLDTLYAQIESDLEKEPFRDARVTIPGVESHKDVVASMKDFMRRRYSTARAQLDNPGSKPADAQRRHGPGGARPNQGPRPGDPSVDAPSDLRIVERKAGAIRLTWKDNATGEVGFIVQRCEGEECDDFKNVVGQPGQDITEATDTNVASGKITYRYRVYAVKPTPEGPLGTGVSNVVTVGAEE